MSELSIARRDTVAAAWLDRRDPRLRVVAAVAFAVVVVSLRALPSLILALMLAGASALAVGVAAATLLRRLLLLEGFLLILVAFLPFTVPGPAAFSVAGWAVSTPGLHRAAEIVLTATSVMLAMLALLATLDGVRLGYALRRLGVPAKLVHLFLFTVRYVGVLHAEYRRLRRAMRARAFVAGTNRHTWRSFGWLFGMLLVRGLERSRRIHAAMKCRAFEGEFHLVHTQHWRPADTLTAASVLLVLTALSVVAFL